MLASLSFGPVVLTLLAATLAGASEKTESKEPAKTATQATAAAPATKAPAPTPDEQVAALEAQCQSSAEARTKRHAEKTLFQRLGGEAKIHALTQEVVRLHLQNPTIKHLFAHGDNDELAKRVAQFMISGTGGPKVYEGPTLAKSHADMKLTNADFMSAGGDIIQAMKNLGYGENEINDVVCTLVGLRDQVVLPKTQKP